MKFFVFSLIIFHPFVLANSPQGLLNKQDKNGLASFSFPDVADKGWPYTVDKRDIEQVKVLIKQGANLDTQDRYGDTLLIRAIQETRIPVAELLIKNNVNLDIQNNVGWTALYYALVMKQLKTAHLLIQYGTNPFIKDNRGVRPVDHIKLLGYTDIAKLIIDMQGKCQKVFT